MKLYKGDKIMQMVDKDQLEDCLEAGWSRTEPSEDTEISSEDDVLEDDVLEEEEEETADDDEVPADPEPASSDKKKILRPLKKRK